MIPSVLSQQLRQGVEDFLKITFPVSTPFFHNIVDCLFAEDGGVFKGPFHSIQPPFRYASEIVGEPFDKDCIISNQWGKNKSKISNPAFQAEPV